MEFQSCDEANQCTSLNQPSCLLLPDSPKGICVKPCQPGGSDCPPWYECAAIAPDALESGYCLDVAKAQEPCDFSKGLTCAENLYCIAHPDTGASICTNFCTTGESICQVGLSCTPLEDDPSWGACLPLAELAVCDGQSSCLGASSCIMTTPASSHCAPQCEQVGSPCASHGSCVAMPAYGGGTESVCISEQSVGQICAPEKGLPCSNDATCSDVGAQDQWKRCLASCQADKCESGVCQKHVEWPESGLCVPLEYAFEQSVACNEGYPCVELGKTCVSLPETDDGICVDSCEQGCPEGSSCSGGGCVVTVGSGEQCLATSGVFCAPPADCRGVSEGAGQGYCALPCIPGDDSCGFSQDCLDDGSGDDYCLTPADYGEPCSVSAGVACAGSSDELTCVKMGDDSKFGFCTPGCEGPGGTCPTAPDGKIAECVFQTGGSWFCVFLCMGGDGCPSGMSCSNFGICMP